MVNDDGQNRQIPLALQMRLVSSSFDRFWKPNYKHQADDLVQKQSDQNDQHPQINAASVRQAMNTLLLSNANPSIGPRHPPRIEVDPEYNEWKRIEAGLRKLNLFRGQDSIVPNSFEDYMAHKGDFAIMMDTEDDAREANEATWEEANEQVGRSPFVASDMPVPNNGLSTILRLPTIWTAVHAPLNPHREVAPWPCIDEFKEEGDERHTSQFGRFMPFPRESGQELWKSRGFLVQEELDEVCPVPTGRTYYAGLFCDQNGLPYDDPRSAGRETFTERNPFDGSLASNAEDESQSMAVVLHDHSAHELSREQLLANLTAGGNDIIRRPGRRRRVTASGRTTGYSTESTSSGTTRPAGGKHSRHHSLQHVPYVPPPLNRGNNANQTQQVQQNDHGNIRSNLFNLRGMAERRSAASRDKQNNQIANPAPQDSSNNNRAVQSTANHQRNQSFTTITHGMKATNFDPAANEFVPMSPELQRQFMRNPQADDDSSIDSGLESTPKSGKPFGDGAFGSGDSSLYTDTEIAANARLNKDKHQAEEQRHFEDQRRARDQRPAHDQLQTQHQSSDENHDPRDGFDDAELERNMLSVAKYAMDDFDA